MILFCVVDVYWVEVLFLRDWKRVVIVLDLVEGNVNVFVVRDFDYFVDSLILVGDLYVFFFEIKGVLYFFVNFGDDFYWNGV